MSTPTLKEICAKATPGPWSVPHFADDECKCDCRYVLCEKYCGAIATIHVANDKPISEGGNDDPVIEEARANGQLIARLSPEVMVRVEELLQILLHNISPDFPNFRKVYDETEAVLALLDGKPEATP